MFMIIFDKKNRHIAWTGNRANRPNLRKLDGISRRYLRSNKKGTQLEKWSEDVNHCNHKLPSRCSIEWPYKLMKKGLL